VLYQTVTVLMTFSDPNHLKPAYLTVGLFVNFEPPFLSLEQVQYRVFEFSNTRYTIANSDMWTTWNAWSTSRYHFQIVGYSFIFNTNEAREFQFG